ncbi:MAG: phosphate/phosphite/phosphonate ABC transporter substrate-binding protein [Deltaproteobacteria bacterium]|nr:phosphate/phosphite/phosphonate ABC transporter substrate-binding protein [Deltaproteobacteria bacterium]
MVRDGRIFPRWVFILAPFALAIPSLGLTAEERLLVFGRVGNNPVRAIRQRQEFVDYIAKKLAPLGITAGRVLVVERISSFAQAIKEGGVDFFHDSVVPSMVLSRWSGSIPLLRQWKYGEADYHSAIVVKKDSGINSLADLKGKVIAFDEPHSTSAHILPRMLLVENNLKLVPFAPPRKIKPSEVGFVHGSDGNAPHILITGRTDAAATSYRELKELRPEIQEGLKVIGKTKSVPRLVISVRKDLDPKIAKALKEVLLNMDKDPEGKAALEAQQKTNKIDEIPPGSVELLREIERFVFSQLGKEVETW